MFTYGAPRSSKNSFRSGRAFQDRIGIWKCWFLKRGENRSTRRKTSRSRVENQQQTQPTGSGSRTRDTLVEGERSHHCANSAIYIMSSHRGGMFIWSNFEKLLAYQIFVFESFVAHRDHFFV